MDGAQTIKVGVGNETAGIIRLAIGNIERLTVTARDVIVGPDFTLELLVVQTLDIPPVVLVVVGELVVHEDGGLHGLGQIKVEGADAGARGIVVLGVSGKGPGGSRDGGLGAGVVGIKVARNGAGLF